MGCGLLLWVITGFFLAITCYLGILRTRVYLISLLLSFSCRWLLDGGFTWCLIFLWWRLGTFFQWIGLSCISAAITVKLFTKRIIQYPFILIPIVIACAILLVPYRYVDTLRLYLIYVLPLYMRLLFLHSFS